MPAWQVNLFLKLVFQRVYYVLISPLCCRNLKQSVHSHFPDKGCLHDLMLLSCFSVEKFKTPNASVIKEVGTLKELSFSTLHCPSQLH